MFRYKEIIYIVNIFLKHSSQCVAGLFSPITFMTLSSSRRQRLMGATTHASPLTSVIGQTSTRIGPLRSGPFGSLAATMVTGRQYTRPTRQGTLCGIQRGLQLTLVPSHLPPLASGRGLAGAIASLGGLGALKLANAQFLFPVTARYGGWAGCAGSGRFLSGASTTAVDPYHAAR